MATTPSSNAKSRRFPRWALIMVIVLGLLLVVALAAPYFLDVDRYRPTIASAIELQTGRAVTLGKIRARFIPQVGFVVEDFHLGNPKGFPAGDVAAADEIRGNLAMGPLLRRTIHLNSLDLVHPKLTLVTDDRGRNNYTFGTSQPAKKSAAANQPASSSVVSLDQIDAIHLSGAEVLLGSIVSGKVVPTADAKNIDVALSHFAISSMSVHDLQAESNLSGVTLELSGWSSPVAFHSGKLTLAGGKLDAQFVADLAKAADIKGTLSVPDVEKAVVNFEMSASKLDLDALLVAAGGGPSRSSSSSSTTTSGSNELVARGHINIERVTSKPYTVGPANAEIRIYGNRAELWPITIGMYGGTLQVSSRVDRVTNPARFTANVQMRSLDVAKVLEETPASRGKMGGTGELDLQLLGNMSDAWRKTLSGSGKFAVRNGHLPGVNLSGGLQSFAKLAGVGSDTPFSVLEGDINIANQRVSSKQIHLDSPSGIVDLRGSIGLDETLDYQGQATLSPAAAVGGGSGAGNILGGVVGGLIGSRVGKITVPFGLGGTIENPKVLPGKGVPSFGAPATTTSTTPADKPAPTPADTINSLKNLFKR